MDENKKNYIEEMKDLVNLEKQHLIDKTKIYCSYDDITNKIRSNLEFTSQKFIEIGYLLKKVKESEIYKICECNSIYEYAKINFGLGETTTKNFINCFEKYGKVLNEFSFTSNLIAIKDEYSNYNYSQLVELLSVPENEIGEFDYNLSVREIKEIKAKKNIELDIQTKIEEMKEFADKELNRLLSLQFTDKIEEQIYQFKAESYKIGKSSFKYSTYSCEIELKANVLFKCKDYKINVNFKFYEFIDSNSDLEKRKYLIFIPSSLYLESKCSKSTYESKLKEYLFSNKDFKKHFQINIEKPKVNDFGSEVDYNSFLKLIKESSSSFINEIQFLVDYINNKFTNCKYYISYDWSSDFNIYLSENKYFYISKTGIDFVETIVDYDEDGEEYEDEERYSLNLLDFINEFINPGSIKDKKVFEILFSQTFDYNKELEIAKKENEKFNYENLEELE